MTTTTTTTSTFRPTKSEIFSVYNKLRAAARREGDTKKVERLNKALGILQSKNYYTGERAEYTPNLFDCGCKDWEFRNTRRRGYTGACKHMLAEEMLSMIYSRRQEHEISAWMDEKANNNFVLISDYNF